ncbi:cysteine-rich hydrophobic domain-containing protein 2 isoform X3 [Rhineura floridana]|uniref:cysteine-rich hydrophobic domain-containing protein 2 isoform X3 n=1 Tax=Rhineura floridana TaxID=261503 RepID=UPI002AC81984|nr:cysteine-rich hydrophobic domain-containing protein 2 isoform X3 [Rhineura floridana]
MCLRTRSRPCCCFIERVVRARPGAAGRGLAPAASQSVAAAAQESGCCYCCCSCPSLSPPPRDHDGRFLPAALRGDFGGRLGRGFGGSLRSRRRSGCSRPYLPFSHSRPALLLSASRQSHRGLAWPDLAMADFDEIYEEEEDEERALEEQLLKHSPDPVVVRGSGHVTVNNSLHLHVAEHGKDLLKCENSMDKQGSFPLKIPSTRHSVKIATCVCCWSGSTYRRVDL